jgi:hypothetical protein
MRKSPTWGDLSEGSRVKPVGSAPPLSDVSVAWKTVGFGISMSIFLLVGVNAVPPFTDIDIIGMSIFTLLLVGVRFEPFLDISVIGIGIFTE